MSTVSSAFMGLFRSWRVDNKQLPVNSNAIPSPALGADLVKSFRLGEMSSPSQKGKFLVHAEVVGRDGQIASASLVKNTNAGTNTYLLNGNSLVFRSGIPMPNEAPKYSNLPYWQAWIELINAYHPEGLPVSVVEQDDGELGMRFPEQTTNKKRDSFLEANLEEIDNLLLNTNESEDSEAPAEAEAPESEKEKTESDDEVIPF